MHQAEIYDVYLLKMVLMDFGTLSISACTNSEVAITIKNNRNYAKIGKVQAVSISTFALKCSVKILQQHLYFCCIPVPPSSHFQSVRKKKLYGVFYCMVQNWYFPPQFSSKSRVAR